MKKIALAGTLAGTLLFANSAFAAEYTVKSGDTLWGISKSNKVSVQQIKGWNHLNSNIIFPGQKLSINEVSKSTGNVSTASTYRVIKGDTISGIAKKFKTTVSKIQSLNPNIQNINFIHIGQVIRVTGNEHAVVTTVPTKAPAPQPKTSTYTLKSGDYLSVVAKKFGISLSTLLALNPQISNPSVVKVGQVITVSGTPSTNTSQPTPPTSKPSTTPAAKPTIPNTGSHASKADAIIEDGKKYLGAKYVYGASTSRTDAFDCSSFTQRVFSENGISLPRTSVAQSKVGTPVSLSNLQKGDLVFFDTNGDGVINHVSIAVDNKTLLHAATSSGVSISGLNSYWKPRAVKAMRVL